MFELEQCSFSDGCNVSVTTLFFPCCHVLVTTMFFPCCNVLVTAVFFPCCNALVIQQCSFLVMFELEQYSFLVVMF